MTTDHLIGFAIGWMACGFGALVILFVHRARVRRCEALLRGHRCHDDDDHDGPHFTVIGSDTVHWNHND